MLWFFIIAGVTYVASAIYAYLSIQKAHYHPQGRWNSIEPLDSDIYFTFCPIINTFFAFSMLGDNWKREEYRRKSKSSIVTTFFKPKKPYRWPK